MKMVCRRTSGIAIRRREQSTHLRLQNDFDTPQEFVTMSKQGNLLGFIYWVDGSNSPFKVRVEAIY